MQGQCPICDAQLALPVNTEKSELVSCSECKNRLHVTEVTGETVRLEEAPKVEEDWGE